MSFGKKIPEHMKNGMYLVFPYLVLTLLLSLLLVVPEHIGINPYRGEYSIVWWLSVICLMLITAPVSLVLDPLNDGMRSSDLAFLFPFAVGAIFNAIFLFAIGYFLSRRNGA